MAEAPIMPLATDAYLADTTHLSTVEHGAYLLLLMTLWRAGGRLPNDPRKLARFARLSPSQFRRVWAVIGDFFYVDGAEIGQGKCDDFLEAVRRKSKSASESARAKWRKTKKTGDANASNPHCERYANQDPANQDPKDNTTTSDSRPRERNGSELPDGVVVVLRPDPSPDELIAACAPVDERATCWQPDAVARFITEAREKGWPRDEILVIARQARASLGDQTMRSTSYLAAILTRQASERAPPIPDKPTPEQGFAARYFERRRNNG